MCSDVIWWDMFIVGISNLCTLKYSAVYWIIVSSEQMGGGPPMSSSSRPSSYSPSQRSTSSGGQQSLSSGSGRGGKVDPRDQEKVSCVQWGEYATVTPWLQIEMSWYVYVPLYHKRGIKASIQFLIYYLYIAIYLVYRYEYYIHNCVCYTILKCRCQFSIKLLCYRVRKEIFVCLKKIQHIYSALYIAIYQCIVIFLGNCINTFKSCIIPSLAAKNFTDMHTRATSLRALAGVYIKTW